MITIEQIYNELANKFDVNNINVAYHTAGLFYDLGECFYQFDKHGYDDGITIKFIMVYVKENDEYEAEECYTNNEYSLVDDCFSVMEERISSIKSYSDNLGIPLRDGLDTIKSLYKEYNKSFEELSKEEQTVLKLRYI